MSASHLKPDLAVELSDVLSSTALFVAGEFLSLYILFGRIGWTGLRELSRYTRGDTFYYKLNPVSKIGVQAVATVFALRASPLAVDVLTIALLASFLSLPKGSEKYGFAFYLFVDVLLASYWGLLYSAGRSHVFQRFVEPSPYTLSALAFVFDESCRSLVVIFASIILLVTTTPSQVMKILEKLRVPVVVTFSIVVAMRELPRVFEALDSITKIQYMRGLAKHSNRLSRPFYALVAFLGALVPAMIYVLRGAGSIAIAADTRGFRAFSRRTYLRPVRFTLLDVAVLLCCVACAAATFV